MSFENAIFDKEFSGKQFARRRVDRIADIKEASDYLLHLMANNYRSGGPDIRHDWRYNGSGMDITLADGKLGYK